MSSNLTVVHFVGFPDNHGRQFQNAVRMFGPPAFMHRFWDQRAQRDIAPDDTVVFASGDDRQPVRRWNGDDQFYEQDGKWLPSKRSPARSAPIAATSLPRK